MSDILGERGDGMDLAMGQEWKSKRGVSRGSAVKITCSAQVSESAFPDLFLSSQRHIRLPEQTQNVGLHRRPHHHPLLPHRLHE